MILLMGMISGNLQQEPIVGQYRDPGTFIVPLRKDGHSAPGSIFGC